MLLLLPDLQRVTLEGLLLPDLQRVTLEGLLLLLLE